MWLLLVIAAAAPLVILLYALGVRPPEWLPTPAIAGAWLEPARQLPQWGSAIALVGWFSLLRLVLTKL